MDAAELFRSELPLVERVIASICRRNCCRGDEAEDFGSWVMPKLIENDYKRLADFQGKSSLSTFLNVTIHRLFLDYRTEKWGRWRPSARARRLGEVAVQLETLTSRDGCEFREAFEILIQNYQVDLSREALEELAAQLPIRARRRLIGEEGLEQLGSPDGVEERVRESEKAEARSKVQEALGDALGRLAEEDRLLLKMRFQDGFTVAGISRSLGLEQRPLYDRFQGCQASLRKSLEDRGVTRKELEDVLEWDLSGLVVDYDTEEEE